ncbi:hypothetical protein FDG2_1540 [Candidatus Protofrankia californiensis]|uniref:Uncharacterized protein n=1 Tax=Candidatus Protofrankia californiensis TaxID=1839754 RepID=A0A1C3NVU9_9ACTN|nr:hypothetical protein FDG2_1540 [Candidatus Protofrankia californiensis]
MGTVDAQRMPTHEAHGNVAVKVAVEPTDSA